MARPSAEREQMSYAKAADLIELAVLAAGRHGGVTLAEIQERFGGVERTAQRMVSALQRCFPDVEAITGDDGRKRWRLPAAKLRDLMTLLPEEIAVLDIATALLRQSGSSVEAETLGALKEKILALVPRAKAARLETDHEALLEAQGLVARPGPRPRVAAGIVEAIGEAIKGCRYLEIWYRLQDGSLSQRKVAPYGVLLGLRHYLVAKQAGDEQERFRQFLTSRIESASVCEEGFARDPAFSLEAFAGRAFGVFQDEREYGEVVWRFLPEVAERAREFEFHPAQATQTGPDGSLIVRFKAAGLLEMCWHLYAWGDKVEVLAPARLREMVQGHRRSDFPGLP